MAVKIKTIYVCQQCAYESVKWLGKCPECGNWSSFQEETRDAAKSGTVKRPGSLSGEQSRPLLAGNPEEFPRLKTGIAEFDRTVGGGLVPGSVTIIGGDPGIGKSTLMLQILNRLDFAGSALYVSGEESQVQVQLRSRRLNINNAGILFSTETDVDIVLDEIARTAAGIVIIDSIQTLYSNEIESLPGNISQLRTCTARLIRFAKQKMVPMLIVGHITKEGNIAGPKVLEHMVDTVLYFEGDNQYDYRILRCTKNRFGAVNEIGLFEMSESGLQQVENPSQLFMSEQEKAQSGDAIVAVLEGNRTFMVQVQALVTKTQYGVPQRTATGIDHRRMNLLLAVLEKRAGRAFGFYDVFIKVSGGLRIEEPGADLGICMALLSSFADKPLPAKSLFLGEVGLSGEIRRVSRLGERIREAQKLGFKKIFIPATDGKGKPDQSSQLVYVKHLQEVIAKIL